MNGQIAQNSLARRSRARAAGVATAGTASAGAAAAGCTLTRRAAARVLAAGVLLLFAAVAGYGESVLVAVEDRSEIEETDDDYAEASRFHLTALEDGIMDVFFEDGHIVFNWGEYEHSPTDEPEIQRRYELREAAEEGGAAVVVQLAVSFERTGEGQLTPSRVRYELWDVDSGEARASGERSAPFESSDEDSDSEAGSASASLGRRIAKELLSEW
ncbi:MAG: hypothetical protein ACQETQ_01010 [Spirochaetota bacterium]